MNYAELTSFILLITLQKSATKLSIKQTDPTSPTLECIAYILKNYFKNITKISLRHSTDQIEMISALVKKINLPIIINTDEIPKIRGIEKRIPDELAIIIDESINITRILNRAIWTATTQFIYTLSSITTEDEISSIFRQFWAHNIINVLLLAPKGDYVYIYGFTPFSSNKCDSGRPELLAAWSAGRTNVPQAKIINKNRLKNLNKCTVNVTVVDLPPTVIFPNKESRNGTSYVEGVEAFILIEIAKKLNFRPKFAVARDGQAWGWIEPEPRGVVGEVFEKKTQIGFGLLASTLERYEYLDVSVPTSCLKECVSWAVPLGAGKFQPSWIYLLVTEFPIKIWCLMITASVFTIATLRISSKYLEFDRNKYDETAKTVIYIFQSSLGVAARAPKSSQLRIVFLSWLWYCFIIYTLYQSSMGSKLTVPFRRPDINTFKELLESDLHFTGFSNTFRLLNPGKQEKYVQEIQKRLEATEYGITEAVDKIVFDRNIAYMRESTTFMYNAMINPKAKGLVHFMKQCAYDYFPTMVLQKRFPLTASVNKIIRTLFEAGLICKWRSRYLYEVPKTDPPVVKLSLEHLTGVFVLFFTGIGIACVAFLAEYFN